MPADFSEFFERYEQLVSEVDKVFEKVSQMHPECVKCEVGCSDCCYALFDLSLIEAMYLNHKFNEITDEETKREILERANTADRQAYRFKKELYDKQQQGTDPEEIFQEVSEQRIRCPLLLEEGDTCQLYQVRPLTCRLYGVPMNIGGRAHTCGRSGFEKGKQYPTVHMDKIQDRLTELSRELAEFIQTKHKDLETIFVPVSMALLTEYDDQYLGIPEQKNECKGGPTIWTPGAKKEE